MMWLGNRENRKVRMHVQDGPSIEGVLAGKTRTTYILWAPKVLTGEKDDPVEVSGHVEIPRERVLWFQVIA
jgi:hypothetical protein